MDSFHCSNVFQYSERLFMAVIFNFILVILEVISLAITLKKKKEPFYLYYTQISNIVCLISSLMLVIFGQKGWVEVLRYLSTAMLTVTFLITVFVLLPTMRTSVLFKGRAFLMHLVCPILCVSSYLFFERHVSTIWAILPVAVTMVYGAILIWLNYKEKFEGPYPFFKIHKIGVKKTAVWMVVLLLAIALISAVVGYRPRRKTDTKYIFVHGLSGWGSYDRINDFFPYWGLSHGDMTSYLSNKGYDSYAASVDPSGSAWDRACELYAQLNGTRVDYGAEHSKRCNHERYGEDFSGRALVKNFDDSRFVLISHSFGGVTVRLFSEILKNGSEEERAYTTDGSLSDFFKGGNGDGLVAIVTLAAPTNGTTAYDLYEDPDFDVASVDVPEEYEKNSDAVSKSQRKKEDGRIKDDYAAYDMHIDNALALNEKITTFPDVYYFAHPFSSADIVDGKAVPNPALTEQMFMKGAIIMANYKGSTAGGFELDESWQDNDGLVNTISAGAPFGAPFAEFKEGEELRPGIWYVFPAFKGDHMAPQGGLTKRVKIKDYYLKMCETLSVL